MCFEYFINQFRCLLAAGTVSHCNCFIIHQKRLLLHDSHMYVVIIFFILAVLIVSRTGPFIGYHTSTNRMLRRTAFAKYLAVRRLAFTLKNIPASTGRIASSFHLRHMELLSRIVGFPFFCRKSCHNTADAFIHQ